MALRLYYFTPSTEEVLVPWLEHDENGAFPQALKGVPNPFRACTRAESLADCDAAFLPNNIRREVASVQAYVTECADAAEAAGKPLFLFSCGDLTDGITFDPRAYVFRYSTYTDTLTSRDIVMPTLVDDLGAAGITIRAKAEVPTVSFCGQAGYKTKKQWLKYYLKVAFHRASGTIRPIKLAHAIGVYWRRVAIAACEASPLVRTHFIIRRSFSAAQRTIELDPEQAKQEFISSIRDTDFVLAPKGDGNYSNRFLEALSMGRIPVLIDTAYTSPFEGEIDYDDLIVRVPMRDVRNIPNYIRAWYDPLTEAQWAEKQQKARALYETRLRLDTFFAHFFEAVLSSLPADARTRA